MAEAQPSTSYVRNQRILCYQHPDCASYDVIRDGIVYRVVPGWPQYRVGEDGSGWGRHTSRQKGTRGLYYWSWLNPQRHSGGYLQFHFKVNSRRTPMYVHRLVLETFVGPCPDGMECRHFPDRDRTNCRLSNLDWGTRTKNHADKVAHGTLLRGSGIANSKLTEEDIPAIIAASKEGATQQQIADFYRVTQGSIGHILSGNTWGHISGIAKVPRKPRSARRSLVTFNGSIGS